MSPFMNHASLYTDFYELTMAQGYLLHDKKEVRANFDYFFRKLPFSGGYVIFAGLGDLLAQVEKLSFSREGLAYLKELGFRDTFLNYLERFQFQGDIYACLEGEVVFPNEPVLRVEGNLIESQLVETLLLNILNFQSLIATKASRVRQVAGNRAFMDFGLRRAQGAAGISASRAAVIGGADSTSNVLSAFYYDLKAVGTMAHSWIESFEDELTAFRTFAATYPDRCVLLVDTYDTLRSGVPNAITVGKELQARGERLLGIRLDSGDLAFLSKKARRMLDEAGLPEVKITVSNQLDEYIIKSLNEQKAPIDAFGVGTRLITGMPDAALDGVYKLSQIEDQPKLKLSENVEKAILPGIKNVRRYFTDDLFQADAVVLGEEDAVEEMHHPYLPRKKYPLSGLRSESLLVPVMKKGKMVNPNSSLAEITRYARERLSSLHEGCKRFENPHIYKVGISERLKSLRSELEHRIQAKIKIQNESPVNR